MAVKDPREERKAVHAMVFADGFEQGTILRTGPDGLTRVIVWRSSGGAWVDPRGSLRSGARCAAALGGVSPRRAWIRAELGGGGGLTMKKKPKASVGDRYDVILTDGGDQKIEVARVVKEITRRHRVAAELTKLFDCPTPIVEGVTEDQAEKIKSRIQKAHGSVKITRARD